MGNGFWVTYPEPTTSAHSALFTHYPVPSTQNPKPQAHSERFTQYPKPITHNHSPQRAPAPLHLTVADPCCFPPIRSLVNVEVAEECRRFLLQHA